MLCGSVLSLGYSFPDIFFHSRKFGNLFSHSREREREFPTESGRWDKGSSLGQISLSMAQRFNEPFRPTAAPLHVHLHSNHCTSSSLKINYKEYSLSYNQSWKLIQLTYQRLTYIYVYIYIAVYHWQLYSVVHFLCLLAVRRPICIVKWCLAC